MKGIQNGILSDSCNTYFSITQVQPRLEPKKIISSSKKETPVRVFRPIKFGPRNT